MEGTRRCGDAAAGMIARRDGGVLGGAILTVWKLACRVRDELAGVAAARGRRPLVTINAHRVVPIGDRGAAPDPGRLEQILRLQESLLLGDVGAANIGGRICQGIALLLRTPATRLVLLDGESVETVATYGAMEFPPIDAPKVRDAIRERRPALAETYQSADGDEAVCTLTLPLQTGEVPVLLQLVRGIAQPFGPDEIALCRYAAALATTALRLGAQRERLEKASGTKSEVLVAMSHDLRSPLNVLVGYTRLLEEEAFGPCSPEQRQVLGSIERYALELLSLLTGVLDLARLDAGRESRREEFTVAEVFAELREGSLSRRGSDGVALEWRVDPELPPMQSDRFRVRQILQNLVDNALRFTDHGTVAIAADRVDGTVRLSVTDTGPGIAADDLPHLFELFRPGRAGASGTGCGLYLVKRFAESLGGRVAVRSTAGEGSSFTVDLPLAV